MKATDGWVGMREREVAPTLLCRIPHLRLPNPSGCVVKRVIKEVVAPRVATYCSLTSTAK